MPVATIKFLIFVLMSIAGLWYATKYKDQWDKIERLGTSKGVSRIYFCKGIFYELFCLFCTLLLLIIDPCNYVSWILCILTIIPLVGNLLVFFKALKYAPYSHKKSIKHKIYRFLRRKLNEHL